MDNLECRKKRFNGKLICKVTGKEITFSTCNSCTNKIYKTKNIENSFHKNKNAQYFKKTVQIKKKTSKLVKMERERFSLFTEDLEHCIFCGMKKDNLHEVIFGSNRLNSIKYGLVIPVCYKHHLECHKNSQLQHVWKVKAQIIFEKTYPSLNFIDIFEFLFN